MCELRIRIRRKVRRSTQGRITRLQCRFFASVDPYEDELFDMISETHFDLIISSYISSGNAVMELYVEFANANGSSPSSTIVTTNMGTKVESESPTTNMGKLTHPCASATVKWCIVF